MCTQAGRDVYTTAGEQKAPNLERNRVQSRENEEAAEILKKKTE